MELISEDDHAVGLRRLATLAFVGLLLFSGIAGVLVGGTGIAAAQQGGGSGNNTTAGNATAGNSTASSGIGNNTTAGNATASSGGGNNTTVANPVNATIQAFKRGDFGYKKLSSGERKKIRNTLNKLARGNSSFNKNGKQIGKIKDVLLYDREVFDIPMDTKPEKSKRVEEIIKKYLGAEGLRGYGTPQTEPFNFTGFDIPSLIRTKLKEIGHTLMQGAADILSNVYKSAFSTPVPENSGWHHILGTPTNQPFKNLYQNLLVEKLYPVTNYLLAIGVVVMGLSLTVNPLISRFRALDLVIKFVTFLMLYAFSWAAITVMHGAVNDVTMWIAPSAKAVGGLVTNVGKMSGIAIGAYFVGSGGIMATAFGLAIELGMRQVLLQYFFPYVFAPLVLVLYISPWQRLQSFASTALWQYVNVLVMVIPMAVFLKAATLINFGNSIGDTLHGMIVLCALFAAAASMPIFTTFGFYKMSGRAAEGVKSVGKRVGNRAGGAAKDRLWGSDDSATDSTATANASPGDQTEEAVEAASETDSGLASSGTVDSTPDTTAAEVRALDEKQHGDPMNPDAMYESHVEEQSQQTTLSHHAAD